MKTQELGSRCCCITWTGDQCLEAANRRRVSCLCPEENKQIQSALCWRWDMESKWSNGSLGLKKRAGSNVQCPISCQCYWSPPRGWNQQLRGSDRLWKQVVVSGQGDVRRCDHFTWKHRWDQISESSFQIGLQQVMRQQVLPPKYLPCRALTAAMADGMDGHFT